MNNNDELLALVLKARKLMSAATPRRYDCGALCSGACCRGDGEVWLLPYEHLYYTDPEFPYKEFFEVKQYENEDGSVTNSLICKCDEEIACHDFRHIRPFWCRIFPLFPRVIPVGYGRFMIKLVMDPRGKRMCPIVAGNERVSLSFKRNVRFATGLLCEEKEFASYFASATEFIDEMERFSERMGFGTQV